MSFHALQIFESSLTLWRQVQCFHFGRELDIESLYRILAGRTPLQVRIVSLESLGEFLATFFLRQLGLGGSAWTWMAQNDNTWQETQVAADMILLTLLLIKQQARARQEIKKHHMKWHDVESTGARLWFMNTSKVLLNASSILEVFQSLWALWQLCNPPLWLPAILPWHFFAKGEAGRGHMMLTIASIFAGYDSVWLHDSISIDCIDVHVLWCLRHCS